jgi:chromosome segregation ATPase
MGKNKGRREETNGDWEASGTEDSLVNGSSGNSTRNRAVASEAGEFRDGNDNDHVNDNAGGRRHRQNRGGCSSQPRRKNSLGPWTNGVSETVQSMEAAHQKIKDLQEMFMSHLDDLENMEETKNKLMQLEEQCSKQENAIIILTNMKRKSEQSIEQERQEIEIERTELEQEKEKLDKRVTTSIAEEKLKFKSELDELLLKHGQSHEKRRTELEEEFAKKKEENDRRVAALEAANQQLSATVKQLKEKIVSQTKELEDSVEQCDLLKRAKDSIKKEKVDLDTELKMVKKEFSLSLKSKDYLYVA